MQDVSLRATIDPRSMYNYESIHDERGHMKTPLLDRPDPKTDKEQWALYWVEKYTELVRSGKTWWQASLDRAEEGYVRACR